MPRPTRAQGRPGTRVIPENWEASHAPVVAKTRTGRSVIHGPATGAPVFDPDLGYSVTPEAPLLHTGTIRVQALSAEARTRLVGDQDQGVTSYLAAIDLDAVVIPVGSVITFTESSDAWLNVRHLRVKNADLGTLRFERDLYCIDDTTNRTDDDGPEAG